MMIRVLFRKEIRELLSFYMYDRKKKRKRSKSALIGYLCLYGFVFISVAFSFFGMATLFAGSIAKLDNGGWIYFGIMSLMAILIGTVIDAFSAYSVLYKPKDQDILLSLPIKPGDLLLSKMISLYLLGFIYSACVYVPMCLAYDVMVEFNVVMFITQFINLFTVSLLVVVLSCLLGYVVALFSKVFKGNNFVSVFVSLVFFGIYYYVMMRMNTLLQEVVAYSLEIAGVIKSFLFPVYHLGLSLCGSIVSTLVFILFVAVVFFICYLILSHSFIRIMTSTDGAKKLKFKREQIRSSSSDRALLKKEFRRFTSSTIYMHNCGIGVFIMLGLVVLSIINKAKIDEFILYMSNYGLDMSKYIPLAVLLMGVFICSTNAVSAPSVSLEGNSIWIVQSLPLKAYDVLKAKRNLHMIINIVPSVLSIVILGIVYRIDIVSVVLLVISVVLYIIFHALFGLYLNLKRPVLDWMNEQVPVKQSMAVMIALFGGYLIAACFYGIFSLFGEYVSIYVYLVVIIIIELVSVICFEKWMRTKGSRIFAEL